MGSRQQRVAVLGAGPAGLAAAHRLAESGREVVVVDACECPGGLSGTLRVDGFGFDFGGHRLITRREAVVEFARELLGEDLLCTTRVSRILFEGRYWSQPLEMSDALRSVTPSVALHAGLGYLSAQARRHRNGANGDRSFEEWVVARFGRPLYEMFFEPYTRKVWGVDPGLIAPEWAPRRIMVSGIGALIKSILTSEIRRPATTARQYFYPRLGCGQLYERFAERCEAAGTSFVYGTRAVGVTREPDRIVLHLDDGERQYDLDADALVSTAPLPDLVRWLEPTPPEDVLAAADALRYRGIVFVFLRLDRSLAMGWDALYVPEPDYVFFRVEEPRYWSKDLAPYGKTSLCLEVAANPGDAVWEGSDEQLVERCVEDLRRIGFVLSSREVLGYDVARRQHVYPMQLVGTDEPRRTCLDYVTSLGRIQSVGRQGGFRYIDMDEAIELGWQAADAIVEDSVVAPAKDFVQEDGYLWDAKRQFVGIGSA